MDPHERAHFSGARPGVEAGSEGGAKVLDATAARARKAQSPQQETPEPGTLLKSNKGAILPCEYNAYTLIGAAQQYAGLCFDEFLSRLRIDGRDWHGADDLDCLRWLQSTHCVAKFTLGQAR